MRNIKMIIEYDGTNYRGWQTQAQSPTVQETIEGRLSKILNHPTGIIASGRTDAGVHALAQVANFKTNSPIDCNSLKKSLNSLLPVDIAIKEIAEENEYFHARFSAKSKIYQYIIWKDKYSSAFYSKFSWWIPYHLDLETMRSASSFLLGKHDFSSFRASGDESPHSLREVFSCVIRKISNKYIFLIEANAFLRYMVRSIVGTLVDVGKGKISESGFKHILESRDRTLAGITAPARGLFLKEVKY